MKVYIHEQELTLRSLDAEEADALCPVRPADGLDVSVDQVEENESSDEGYDQLPTKADGSFRRWQGSIRSFVGKWSYATIPTRGRKTAVQRKPIPFDLTFFSILDRKFTWPAGGDSEHGEYLQNEPIVTTVSPADPAPLLEDKRDSSNDSPESMIGVVIPHGKLQPWEDIPPFETALGFKVQPAYTAEYDDFLWLPRDPLSTLDLDDTVEGR